MTYLFILVACHEDRFLRAESLSSLSESIQSASYHRHRIMAKSGGTSVIKGAAVVFIMGLTLIIVMMAAMEMQGGGRASSPPTEKIANKNLREARGVVAKTPQIAEPPPSLISDPLVGLPENSL